MIISFYQKKKRLKHFFFKFQKLWFIQEDSILRVVALKDILQAIFTSNIPRISFCNFILRISIFFCLYLLFMPKSAIFHECDGTEMHMWTKQAILLNVEFSRHRHFVGFFKVSAKALTPGHFNCPSNAQWNSTYNQRMLRRP